MNSLLHYVESRQAAMRDGTRLTKRGTRFSSHSAGGYATLVKHLRIYDASAQAEHLDQVWWAGFLAYLLSTDLRHNSVCSAMRKGLSLAKEQCRATGRPTPDVASLVLPEATTKIYHPPAELQKLAAADLSQWSKLAGRRDAYLIQCYTGLRYSDLRRVLDDPVAYTEHSQGRSFWRLRQQKTSTEVVIPLRPEVLALLTRQGGRLALPSLQFYNLALKEAARRAGITQPVTVAYTQHGRPQHRPLLKCTLVSSHTARRTFATNAYLAGVPSRQIMLLTGHRTEAAFLTYIRADGLAVALSLAEHPFFN